MSAKKKNITESALFKKTNVLLLERNRVHLDMIKDRLSMHENIDIDTSVLIRALIEFLYDNPKYLKKLSPYLQDLKGYRILELLEELMEQGLSIEELSEKTGIGIDILETLPIK